MTHLSLAFVGDDRRLRASVANVNSLACVTRREPGFCAEGSFAMVWVVAGKAPLGTSLRDPPDVFAEDLCVRLVAVSFFGDGAGNTVGSLALNCLTWGLAGTGLVLLAGSDFRFIEGLWSSGKSCKFRRRLTSYTPTLIPHVSQFLCGANLDVARSKSARSYSHSMTTPGNLLLK